MSTTAKVSLGLSVVFTTSMIAYVHISQKLDKQRMKEGVLMDIERQQRKIQNLKMLQEQQELTKAYRRAIVESKEQE